VSKSRAALDPLQRLAALGADALPHVDGSLAAHLQGTHALLQSFGNRDALCLAGLYHAVYGTAGFRPSLVDVADRRYIADIIGTEAEELAYLYGACDRSTFHPRIGGRDQCRFADRFNGDERTITLEALRDFCELTVANELELASRNTKFRARYGSELRQFFERMNGLLTPAATRACQTMLRNA
jgi:hypothetical protein